MEFLQRSKTPYRFGDPASPNLSERGSRARGCPLTTCGHDTLLSGNVNIIEFTDVRDEPRRIPMVIGEW
jgi:hypothetical protein